MKIEDIYAQWRSLVSSEEKTTFCKQEMTVFVGNFELDVFMTNWFVPFTLQGSRESCEDAIVV